MINLVSWPSLFKIHHRQNLIVDGKEVDSQILGIGLSFTIVEHKLFVINGHVGKCNMPLVAILGLLLQTVDPLNARPYVL